MRAGMPEPALFGLMRSNHDFTRERSWGKNIFANTFPAALACYMHSRQINPVYLRLDSEGRLVHSSIRVTEIYGVEALDADLFYAFEYPWSIYQPLVIGRLPVTDLVVMDTSGKNLHGIEIKLTALPDNSTWELSEAAYGCEIVTRPDTIVYLALSIASIFKDNRAWLLSFLGDLPAIADWTNAAEVRPLLPVIADVFDNMLRQLQANQQPLILQAVWKTEGKRLKLHANAFDIFVWSNFAFTRLFIRAAYTARHAIDRPARAVIWLVRMLLDFAHHGQINHRQIIATLSYDTRNDKAFSVSGRVTQPLMQCAELLKPRIHREEVKNIILGGGQNLLSPERRLDAVLMGTPEFFS
jgi:hypothetical protein